MKTSVILTAMAATLSFSAVVEARTSSDAEMSGYKTCLKQADQESNGLVPSRYYLIDKSGKTTLYYINATRWEDGTRSTVRVACETSTRGKNLLTSSIEQGRFENEGPRVTVEVAQR